jgi:large conductance mechanosensitive channel
MKALREFKEFILRGNVVDLAVAVVIGAAFGAVIAAFVADIITPLLGITGGFSFPDWSIPLRGNSRLLIGAFLNAVISFIIIAAVIFFLVVRPILALTKRHERNKEATTQECPYCLSTIPIKATRCAFCTSELPSEHLTPTDGHRVAC